ncbi:antibiotic biosynthesis monooxygenase family protein [Larkinella bovis]|uniref:Antibiotic biosynthesis monooxygenase family protein n=1 Tax=Larkinella bovis TaxID=683041 RepID=A0ABW0ID91_9BACT
MYARVIQVPLKPDAIDQATQYFRESVGPALKELNGFKNSRFLTDPATNKCLMVTLWESEQARKDAESNGFLQDVLSQMKGYFAGPPTIDYYEVGVQVI